MWENIWKRGRPPLEISHDMTKKIIMAYEKGCALRFIALKMGISAPSVAMILEKNGIKRRNPHHRKIPREEIEQMILEYLRNQSFKKISLNFHRNVSTVYYILKKKKIKFRRPGRPKGSKQIKSRFYCDL